MPTEIFLIKVAKAIIEITGMFMIGQGVLYLFAGNARHQNFVYQLFAKATTPLMMLARLVSPKVIADRHVWIVALAILFWLYVAVMVLYVGACADHPGPWCARES